MQLLGEHVFRESTRVHASNVIMAEKDLPTSTAAENGETHCHKNDPSQELDSMILEHPKKPVYKNSLCTIGLYNSSFLRGAILLTLFGHSFGYPRLMPTFITT